ncbi:MAG: hypothetical protein EB060_11380, partial [Proteobacteria bacterium]|nr:hypothetical protein [Pseudomonadota bacterium]
LVAFPDQVLQRAIVFVVFLIVPDLERISVKVFFVIAGRFVIGEYRKVKVGNVHPSSNSVVTRQTDKETSGRKDSTGLGRVVHAINVAD